MSDIFREVEEAVRRERLNRLWRRYGSLIVGAAVLFALAVGGFTLWRWWDETSRAQAGARFETALAQTDEDDRRRALEALAAQEPGAYGALARFHRAAEHARAGERRKAVAVYDRLVQDPELPPIMQDLARLNAGFLLAGQIDFTALRARLGPAAADGRPFRFSAREALAVAALEAGDAEAARSYLEALIAAPEAPPSLAARARALIETALPARFDTPEEPKEQKKPEQ